MVGIYHIYLVNLCFMEKRSVGAGEKGDWQGNRRVQYKETYLHFIGVLPRCLQGFERMK